MEHNSYFNPGGLSGSGVVNTPRWRAAQCPSTNAHGTARGVARVYAALISRTAIVDPAALTEATAEQVYGQDLVLHRPSRFGLGFQLTQPERPIGPGQATFGHFGAGGSLGFADPGNGIAFGYVMNQMGPRWQNPRTRALVDAVYACP
jgi:CubicO group peptidase (beta-lactamase class C family)